MRPLNIFTWHIHGSYLYYLSHVPHTFIIPKREQMQDGYYGRTKSYPWHSNVLEVPADEIKNQNFDCILFQSQKNYEFDQYDILTKEQRNLPKIYLEHDPPRAHPTDTIHPVNDSNVLLVHVTNFNELMWNARSTPTKVIEHGVKIPDDVSYSGNYERGVVLVNNIALRGRRLGCDIFEKSRTEIPLDLLGMASHEVGGIGEIPHHLLPAFMSKYRFFFNPIRYTSFGLSMCEAMMVGLPIIAFATTEIPTVIRSGRNGFIDTNIENLISYMKLLLRDKGMAAELGEEARNTALERFDIRRFIQEWLQTFAEVTANSTPTGIQVPVNRVIQPHHGGFV